MAYDKLDYTQIEYDDLKCRARLKGLRQDNDSDYENGRLRIPIEYLVRLAGFYNVDVSYICGISNDKLLFLHEDRVSIRRNGTEIIITRRRQ